MPRSTENLGSLPGESITDSDGNDSSKAKKTGGSVTRLTGVAPEILQADQKKRDEDEKPRSSTFDFLKKFNMGDTDKKPANTEKPAAEESTVHAANPEKTEKPTPKAEPETETKDPEQTDVPARENFDKAESPTANTSDNKAETDTSDSTELVTEAAEEAHDELTPEEAAEAKADVSEMIELGLEDSREQAEAASGDAKAEASGAVLFYSNLREGMAAEGAVDLNDLPEAAAQATAEQINAEADEAAAAESTESVDGIGGPEAPGESAETLDEPTEADEDDAQQAAAGAGGNNTPPQPPNAGNGNTGGNPPNQPPQPPFPPNGPGGPLGPAGPGGPFGPNQNPIYQNYAGNLPPNMPMAPNIVTANPNTYGDPNAAGAQGLVVGGVVGYFIGRHRGRKQGAKAAEKQAAPVRRNLERQVASMQEAITAKEIQIRTMARDRMQNLQTKKERDQFVERILQPPAERAIEKAALPLAVAAAASAERSPASAEAAGTTAAAAAESRGSTATAFASTEARPTTVPSAVEFGTLSHGTELLLGDHRAEQAAEIIPFNKPVSEFSQQELMATAEKIKLEGTTLREMAELGRLTEPGLRRVVAEFIRGGNVEKVAAHEIKEKELQYEQDPRMRHHADGQDAQAGAAGGGSGGLAPGGLQGQQAVSGMSDTQGADVQKLSDTPHPQLTPEQLQELRNRQVRTVAVTTLLIILAIVIVVWLTR